MEKPWTKGALINNSASYNYSIDDIKVIELTDEFDPLKSVECSINFFPFLSFRIRGDGATSLQAFKAIVENKLDKPIDLKKLYYGQLDFMV